MDPQTSQPASYNTTAGRGHATLIAIILAVLLVGALGFGGWAFSKMQDYKNNSDKKSAAAVTVAEKAQAAELQAKFEEQSKSPFKQFVGSPTYGSITFDYPKTWSAYVDTSQSTEPINGYFHPDQVPGIQSKSAFALRLELVSTDYTQLIQQLSSQIQAGKVTAQAYLPPRLSGVANVQPGTMFSGQVNAQDLTQTGKLLAIKVRDKTLEISTESPDFSNDFANTILSSLKFAP